MSRRLESRGWHVSGGLKSTLHNFTRKRSFAERKTTSKDDIPSFLRDCFIEVQEDSGGHRPGGGVLRSGTGRQVGEFSWIAGRDVARVEPAFGEALPARL